MKIRRAIAVFRGEHQFHVDFIGRKKVWFLISGVAILISIAGFVGRGLNLGIDFEGGALLTYPNESGASVQEITAILEDQGHPGSSVQITGDNEVRVRTEPLGPERPELRLALAEASGVQPDAINVEDVGPKWGAQISEKALIGLIIFLVVVTLYISFRFEWKMALSALIALFHDLIITVGVYALVGREVTPETVIAVLTILGYSLYDTVVIFDKIKENAESPALVSRLTYGGMVNLSLNQVLMRSVNTSLVVLLPVGTLMLYGGEVLQNFAFALFVGLLLGAYSSVFLAAPLVAVLKEREPKLAEIKDRASRRDELATSRTDKPAPKAEPVKEKEQADEPEKRELVTATAPRPSATAQAKRPPKKKSRAKRKRR